MWLDWLIGRVEAVFRSGSAHVVIDCYCRADIQQHVHLSCASSTMLTFSHDMSCAVGFSTSIHHKQARTIWFLPLGNRSIEAVFVIHLSWLTAPWVKVTPRWPCQTVNWNLAENSLQACSENVPTCTQICPHVPTCARMFPPAKRIDQLYSYDMTKYCN